MRNLIEITNLNKIYRIRKRTSEGRFSVLKNFFSTQYNDINAVSDLSLYIKKGEIVGYIGTNGAGKSTTIKMMTGILNPTSGSIRVNGMDPFKDRSKYVKDIGVIFGQKSQLFWDIPVIESLKLLKKIYDVPQKDFDERLQYFSDALKLDEILNQSVRQLSLGQKMRAEFAAAFLHNPKVVFLDEPTIGLDVNIKYQIRKFVKKMNMKFDTTIILTTHDLQDIEYLCHRVVIINKGTKMFDGPLRDVYRLFDSKKTVIVTHDERKPIKLGNEFFNLVNIEQTNGNSTSKLSFLNREVETAKLINSLLENNEINDLTVKNSTIEEIIRSIYVR